MVPSSTTRAACVCSKSLKSLPSTWKTSKPVRFCLTNTLEPFLTHFHSVRKFKIFNTNNLWINLRALKRVMETEGMELEIIINPKVNDDGQAVVQLETAAGAAIKHFKNAHGINVPRSRFLPVKSCSDLLLIKSDIYSLQHGQLVVSPDRLFGTSPVIKLGDHFKKVRTFVRSSGLSSP